MVTHLLAVTATLALPPSPPPRPLTPLEVEKITSSSRPAFVMVLPEDCDSEQCRSMVLFWGMAGHFMPQFAWLCDCRSGEGFWHLCKLYGSSSNVEVLQWGKDGIKKWTPYEGPRSPDALLAVMRAVYQELPLATEQDISEASAFEAQINQTDPTDGEAVMAVAVPAMMSENALAKELAVELLERAFSSEEEVDLGPISLATRRGRALAYQVFVHRWLVKDYARGRAALVQALSAADDALVAGGESNHCWRMQLATMTDQYPASEQAAALVMSRYAAHMRQLLELSAIVLPAEHTYNFCLFGLFDHSFYYDADLALNARLFTAVAAKAFPFLLRTPSPAADGAAPAHRACGSRVRLGIASACFTSSSHPVPSDFGGMLRRLSPRDFELVHIHLDENDEGSEYLSKHGIHDFVHLTMRSADWLEAARARIAALQLDLLLYLDLTMSSMANQVAMVRLAPVTAVSHGHPVTSGVPREAMDYYISWAAAELPTAAAHYTEQLVLLPEHTMHQYYESRIGPANTSMVDGGAFGSMRRQDFDLPAHGRWYLCMQKPFKLSPAFDEMLGGIHAADPDGFIILHEIQLKGSGRTSSHHKKLFAERLSRAGVDLARLHFVPQQSHHRLLGLYSLADVVLDSYYAGGCTTTREALELGALVVTLPAKYLGSRWSLAYYSIMGVTELVARDKRHYVEIAVRMATDADAASSARQRILGNVHKLFHRDEAVEAWSAMLKRLAKPTTSNCSPAEEVSQEKLEL